MKNGLRKGKSIIALLLALAMFFVGIPTGSRLAFAEDTNYALNGTVTSSNTNADYATAYPSSQITDGVRPYTRPAEQTAVINYQDDGLAYYEITLLTEAQLNQVRVYFNQAEPEKRPKDIAIDLQKADGTWVRAAEMHNIDYDNALIVTSNPRYLAFNFEAVESISAIRITANKKRNNSSNFRLMEVEAYLDDTITTYTGTTEDANADYNIPKLGTTETPDISDSEGTDTLLNYALNGNVTSSNTNESLAAGYPAAQVTDGNAVYTRPADQTAVINYQQNGLAYYEIELQEAAKINQVRLYFNQVEPEKRPKDIAIDVQKADGTWVRAAEMQNIDYDKALIVTSNPRYLAFDFEAIESAAVIRVTANRQRNNSTNFRLMEVEAYYDPSINTYTNYFIPELETTTDSGQTSKPDVSTGDVSDNYALNGAVTSSNTNESLAAGYPAAQVTDGNAVYTRPAEQSAVINYQGNGLAYYQVALKNKAKINQVRVYFNQAEPEKRPKDIAVDVQKADGTWVRAAEMHNIDYDKSLVVTSNPRYLSFSFQAIEDVKAIRVTGNQKRNDSTNFRLMEIEAYLDTAITTYTGTTVDSNANYNIPAVGATEDGGKPGSGGDTVSGNFALNGEVTSSNTNESLAAGYPAVQVTDGNAVYTRAAEQSAVINYQENGLAYYQVTLKNKAKINQVRVYFNQAEPEKRPKDIAVDVQKADGTWVRAAEMHNINYDKSLVVTSNPRYLAFNFKAVNNVKKIRVTANQARNDSTNFRLMEIEAYFDKTITKYTGKKQDTNAKYNIPQVGQSSFLQEVDSDGGSNSGGKNYALDGKVTSSNTNDGLAASYPAEQITDGVTPYTRPAEQTAVINYTSQGLAYYEIELKQKAQINQVRVYFNQAEPEKRPKDIAVDIKKADGTWVRVAEMHNIDYDEALVVTSNPRYLAFNFEKLEATTIRVTANRTRNESDSTNFRLMEIEAYLDATITTYTGVKPDDNEAYNIPLLSVDSQEEETQEPTQEEEAGADKKEEYVSDENESAENTVVQEVKSDNSKLVKTAGALIGTTLLVSMIGIAAYLIWSKKKATEGKNEKK